MVVRRWWRDVGRAGQPATVAPFDAFETRMDGAARVVPVRLRAGVTSSRRDALVRALDAVPWPQLQHAYGAAADVRVALYAVTLGEAEARRAAWWELWGTIHHQGTVYSATVAAVPFLAAIAAAPDHPERVQALCLLRDVAVGDGHEAPAVRAAVRPVAEELLRGARGEPETVQRAMLWLLSAFPSLVGEHEDLRGLLPVELRQAWEEVLDRVRRPDEDWTTDDARSDREHELEAWALAGWVEP